MLGAVGRPGMDEMRWHSASAVLLYFLIRIQRKEIAGPGTRALPEKLAW